MPAAVAIKI